MFLKAGNVSNFYTSLDQYSQKLAINDNLKFFSAQFRTVVHK